MGRLFFSKIIDYIYPPRCISCSELMIENGGFCHTCWSKLNFLSEPYCKICCFEFEIDTGSENSICLKCMTQKPTYDFARSILKFDEQSKQVIHNLKYYDNTKIAVDLAKVMVSMHRIILSDIDLIIPVPMYKFKRIFRLYNQAQILSYELSKILKKPMIPNVLLKSKHTKSQTGLSKRARELNLIGSFTIANKHKIAGQKIMLVDDVMTTGSTINLCSKKLKDAGASKVIVACIARTNL